MSGVKRATLEPVETRVRSRVEKADNQVEVLRISGLRQVDRRWHGGSPGVGVIEPDHIEAAGARRPPGIDVPLRIDQKTIGGFGEVPGPDRLHDICPRAEKDPAALPRPFGLGVCDDGGERRGVDRAAHR